MLDPELLPGLRQLRSIFIVQSSRVDGHQAAKFLSVTFLRDDDAAVWAEMYRDLHPASMGSRELFGSAGRYFVPINGYEQIGTVGAAAYLAAFKAVAESRHDGIARVLIFEVLAETASGRHFRVLDGYTARFYAFEGR